MNQLNDNKNKDTMTYDNKLDRWIIKDYKTGRSVIKSKTDFGRDWELLTKEGSKAREIASRLNKLTMLDVDGVEHQRHRWKVSKEFTPQAIALHEPMIQEIIDDLIAEVKDKENFDFISEIAIPLPARVIGEILGVEKSHQLTFKQWAMEMVQVADVNASQEVINNASLVMDNAKEYCRYLIEKRRKDPKNDLISRLLLDNNNKKSQLSDSEIVDTCTILIAGGNLTTTDFLGNGLVTLLKNRNEFQKLCENPDLISSAINEMLRYDSPTTQLRRYSADDLEISGVKISKGSVIIIDPIAANHDPKKYNCPHKFDVERDNAASHLSFGGGMHYCIGAHLVHLEVKLLIKSLITTFPNLSLSKIPEKRKNTLFNGYDEVILKIS